MSESLRRDAACALEFGQRGSYGLRALFVAARTRVVDALTVMPRPGGSVLVGAFLSSDGTPITIQSVIHHPIISRVSIRARVALTQEENDDE